MAIGRSKPKIGDFDKDEPLKMLKGETSVANQALHDYAHMGIARSLWKLIDRYKLQEQDRKIWEKNPKDWEKGKPIPKPIPSKQWKTISDWSAWYLWQERVRRFDEIEREHDAIEFQNERSIIAKQRRDLARAYFRKTVQALAAVEPDTAKWVDVNKAVENAMNQLREEFGGGEASKVTGKVKMVQVVLSEGSSAQINVNSDDDEE